MYLALQFASVLFIIGQIIDKLPGKMFQEISLDTKVFVLRLFGRTTPLPTVTIASSLLSLGAGLSEELFFRGFLFILIQNYLGGQVPAYIISSSLFGLAHTPVFGANAALEAFFGGFFAFSFVYSGYNLGVPIAAHALYDFTTILITWWFASKEIQSKIIDAEYELANLDENLYNSLVKGVSYQSNY